MLKKIIKYLVTNEVYFWRNTCHLSVNVFSDKGKAVQIECCEHIFSEDPGTISLNPQEHFYWTEIYAWKTQEHFHWKMHFFYI